MSELRPVAATARGAWNNHMLATTQSAFESVFKAVSEGHTVLNVTIGKSAPVITVERSKLCDQVPNVSRSMTRQAVPQGQRKTICTAKYGAARLQWFED